MNDLGGVDRERLVSLLVLLRNQSKYTRKFRKRFFASGHEGMAARYGWNLRNSTLRLVAVQHHFVVVEAHRPSLYCLAGHSDWASYCQEIVLETNWPSVRST
jgi:hypothetical protein